MTEYEILDLVNAQSAQSATQFTLYLSVLFAYVATVYFVGAQLTRAQAYELKGSEPFTSNVSCVERPQTSICSPYFLLFLDSLDMVDQGINGLLQ